MAKSRKLAEILAQIAELRAELQEDPTSAQAIDELRQMLKSKFSVAVAQVSKLVSDHEITPLIPDLVAAFDRFFIKPVDIDPNCHAKAGIADALYRLGHSDAAVFLKGIRHVQLEPIWGGKVDTAPKLRSSCAMGLVRMNYANVLTELADLLADPEIAARIAAAKAIAYNQDPNGIPLLRLRIQVGDEPPVLSECFAALLQLAPEQSLDFVASFLDAPQPQTQELVALLLGETRLPKTFEILRQWWERTPEASLRRTGLLAIATLRQDQPLEFLLLLIGTGTRKDAQDAIAALSIYREEHTLWQRVYEAVEQRGDPALLKTLA